PEAGFGGWHCRWESTTSPSTLLLLFDQNQPLTADDGTPTTLGGHKAFVQPDGYDDKSCQISVVGRKFTDVNGQSTVELLEVVATGPQPKNQLCSLAKELAAPAAANLPA